MKEKDDFGWVSEALEEINDGFSEIIEIVSGSDADSSNKRRILGDEGNTSAMINWAIMIINIILFRFCSPGLY